MIDVFYGWMVRRRNSRFDAHKTPIHRVSVPVFSVGNLSVGGTGKTPFTQFLARELTSLGVLPAIVSRGYGRKSSGQVVVSDGNNILADVRASGDELQLHARSLSVPVIADANRVRGAETAISQFHAQAVILDDGFQHRRLARDCDIVLIDRNTLEQKFLLPKGRLREPFSSLKRAQVVVAVGDVELADIPSFLRHSVLLLKAVTEIGEIRPAFRQEKNWDKTGIIPHQAVAFCGIAKPERFFPSIPATVSVKEKIEFSDHFSYEKRHIQTLVNFCRKHSLSTLLTTEKDEVKIAEFAEIFAQSAINVCVLPIQTRLESGEKEFKHCIQSIINRGT